MVIVTWAHPASLSMGTLHIGHRLMLSLQLSGRKNGSTGSPPRFTWWSWWWWSWSWSWWRWRWRWLPRRPHAQHRKVRGARLLSRGCKTPCRRLGTTRAHPEQMWCLYHAWTWLNLVYPMSIPANGIKFQSDLWFCAGTDVADCVAAGRRAPSASSVHTHLCVQPAHKSLIILFHQNSLHQPECAMLVKELLVSEPLHLVLAEHPLSGAVGVRARDVVGALHHLECDVLLHALQEGQVASVSINQLIHRFVGKNLWMTSLQNEQPHSSSLTMAEAGQS